MVVSSAVAALMGGVAHARRGSAIHEVGTVYSGRLRTTGHGPGPFAVRGEQPVLIRVSRAIGLPPPLPDVFGIGIRLATADGPQDLLLDTCGGGPLGRHVLVPRLRIDTGAFGTLIALTDGDRTFHLAGVPRSRVPLSDTAAAAGLVVVLAAASPFGPPRTVGAVRCDAPADDQGTRMSPANSALGVGFSPWWQQFRVRSYGASRRRSVTRSSV